MLIGLKLARNRIGAVNRFLLGIREGAHAAGRQEPVDRFWVLQLDDFYRVGQRTVQVLGSGSNFTRLG